MKRIPVDSSCVKDVGYDEATQTMEINFWKTGVYSYPNVTLEFFEMVVHAPSIGAFVNKAIKQGNLVYFKGSLLGDEEGDE
jgi:hypothetical protein